MREILGGLFFAAGALLFAFFFVQGVFGDSVRALGRNSHMIFRDAEPYGYAFTLLMHLGSAALFAAISAFIFVMIGPTRKAERRFFQQRDYLAPKKD